MAKQKVYSPKFKLMIVKKMLENQLSYAEIFRKYFPHLKYSRGTGVIRKWMEIYLNEGQKGLKLEQRNRNRIKMKKIKKADVKKANLREALQENERLRAENAFLKKLRALVLEEEQENLK